jgi:cytochrome c oxidase cbb3-type subunit 3
MHWIIGILLLGITTLAACEPRGDELYAAHCSACHGESGSGGVGVPLSLPSFLDSVDNDYLRSTIRHGRPGRVMPAFTALSDAQVNAIVRHIRGWSKNPAPDYPATAVKGDAGHGKALFSEHCAVCHGGNGEGGTGTGVTFSRKRSLPIIAPALNNPGFLAAATDQMIRYTLQNGREGTPMGSFLEKGLSEQDIDDIVSYVRTFEDQQSEVQVDDAAIPAAISMESPYTLEETVENLKNAIISQNFVLIREVTLEYGLTREGEEDPSEIILHFCNFKFLYEALKIDPRIGMFLPCRVTVTEINGKVMVTTINPMYLGRLFNNNELNDYCEKMYDLYTSILEDATL